MWFGLSFFQLSCTDGIFIPIPWKFPLFHLQRGLRNLNYVPETFPYYKHFFKPLLISTSNTTESEYENKTLFLLMEIIKQNNFAQLIHWKNSYFLISYLWTEGGKRQETMCQINYSLRTMSPVKAEMNIRDLHHFHFNLLQLVHFRLFPLY